MHEPYPGEPVPAVNAADLKSVWALCQDLESPLHRGIVAVDSIIEHACSPGADIHPVIYRCRMPQILETFRGDLLSQWKQTGQFQDGVFRVAAGIPMYLMGEGLFQSMPLDAFDVDAFFEEVRRGVCVASTNLGTEASSCNITVNAQTSCALTFNTRGLGTLKSLPQGADYGAICCRGKNLHGRKTPADCYAERHRNQYSSEYHVGPGIECPLSAPVPSPSTAERKQVRNGPPESVRPA